MKKVILYIIIGINFLFANNLFFSLENNINPYLYKEEFDKYFKNFITSYNDLFKKDQVNYNNFEFLSKSYFNIDCLLTLYNSILVSDLPDNFNPDNINNIKEIEQLPENRGIINEYLGIGAYTDITKDMNETTCKNKLGTTDYQCVEFVKRFYKNIFNIKYYSVGFGANTARAYGNKNGSYNGIKLKTKYFQLTDSNIAIGKIAYDINMKRDGSINGHSAYISVYKSKFNYIFENYKPLPGSIISFSPSPWNSYGHTAIVKYLYQVSSNKYIVGIIEQNYISCKHKTIGVNRILTFEKINNEWSIRGIGNVRVVGWTIPFKIERKKCINRKNFAILLSLLFSETLKRDLMLKFKNKLIKIKNEKGEDYLKNLLRSLKASEDLINLLVEWINGERNDGWMVLHLNNIWFYNSPEQNVTKNLYNITFTRILVKGLENETK